MSQPPVDAEAVEPQPSVVVPGQHAAVVVRATDGLAAPPPEWLVDVCCPLCTGTRHRNLYRVSARFGHRGAGHEHAFPLTRCEDCGLDQVSRRLRSDVLAQHRLEQTTWGEHGTDPRDTTARHRETLDAIEAAWRRGRRSNAGRRLLDVACGDGAFVIAARQAGWEVAGIEISPPAAAYGREVRRLPIRTGRLQDAGYPAASFDTVTLRDALEQSEDPVGLLREVRRILRPGGLLYADAGNARGLAARLRGAEWPGYDPADRLAYFAPPTLRRLARESGFIRIRTSSRSAPDGAAPPAAAPGPGAALLAGVKKIAGAGLRVFGLAERLTLLARRPY